MSILVPNNALDFNGEPSPFRGLRVRILEEWKYSTMVEILETPERLAEAHTDCTVADMVEFYGVSTGMWDGHRVTEGLGAESLVVEFFSELDVF